MKPHIDINAALCAFARGEMVRGPSAREFGLSLGLASKSNGLYWIRSLQAAGLIEAIPAATPANARCYRLTAAGRERAAGMKS